MSGTPFFEFRIPRLFHMGYAPLGRYLRRRLKDPWLADSRLILAVTSLVLALMLVNQVAWAFLRESVLAEPVGAVALGFWAAQLGAGLLFFFGCVYGFKPEISVTATSTGLHLDDGIDPMTLPYGDILGTKRISALNFHRHYRRFEATRVFVNRIDDEQLLLWTPTGPVVLGLSPRERLALETFLEGHRDSVVHEPGRLALSVDAYP